MRDKDTTLLTGTQSPIIEVGVDWLTMTSPSCNSDHDLTLAQWYEAFRPIHLNNGMVESCHKLGYQGLATEGAFIGTRHDGAMLMLSGDVARNHWLSFTRHGAHVTRLDLQVTIQWNALGLHPARMAALHAEAANEALPTSRKRSIRETHDNQGGYTTYIGSRQSASFARIYHKSAQSPDAYGPGAYRYEVQFNRDSAPEIVNALQRHEEVQEAACIALVWDWHERRGVIPFFRRSGEVVTIEKVTLPLTDLDKKLAWLYNQVRPTVELLLAQGHEEAVLVALLGRSRGVDVQRSLRTLAETAGTDRPEVADDFGQE